MNTLRHPKSWNNRAVAFLTLALLAGCQHPRPLGYLPREGKFESPLLVMMAKTPTNELIHVVATLRGQVSEADKRRVALRIKAANRADGLRESRQGIIEELKSLARQTQAPVLAYLRELESIGLVKEVRPLWIVNAIAARVSPMVLSNLAGHEVVASLHYDPPRPLPGQTAGQIGNGLEQIGLPGLPESDFRQDVVVAVIDSGVDAAHPDLTSHMWNHPSSIPTDLTGHGTRAAGIIVGDGTGGTRTGVAPQARVMVLRPTGINSHATEHACLEAIQYALDNGARIINFSVGWNDDANPMYAAWRTAVQNVTDIGVLFVTVAGNSGNSVRHDPPFQVKIPGRVPAAFTVAGGMNGHEIMGGSGRGPVTWENVDPFFDYPYPPGLLKPDLAAPGYAIKSTIRGGGYGLDSGTSWAAPHVAGMAALLLGQAPELTPYELRYIMEESAVWTESHQRPDEASGWGHLNAPAALALTIDPTPFDLFVTNLHVKPPPAPGQKPLLSATLTNLGGQVVGNAEMRFYVSTQAQCTVNDLDPNGDGVPDEGVFTHAGSYFVPVLGPGPSRHGGFEGVVRWTNAVPATAKWMGVWVLPGATSGVETKPLNNGAVAPIAAGGF